MRDQTPIDGAAAGLSMRALGRGLGVEVLDVDLSRPSDPLWRGIAALQAANSLVLIRGQSIAAADYVALGRRLGELMPHTRLEYTVPGQPEIYVLSNKKLDGQPIGVHLDGLGWHSDGTYLRRPLAATLLHALEVPPEGGDTLFADSCAGFAALDPAEQRRLEGLRVVYSFAYLMQSRFPDYVVSQQQHDENPEVSHPLVLARPSDGRRGLYMSNGSARGIEGMPDEEGRALLARLTDFVTAERFVWRHRWRAGDIVIWSNLCTLHSATLYDDQRYERHLHRLWVRVPEPATEPARGSGSAAV